MSDIEKGARVENTDANKAAWAAPAPGTNPWQNIGAKPIRRLGNPGPL